MNEPTKKQLGELYRISTSILPIINHDLSGSASIIKHQLEEVEKLIDKTVTSDEKIVSFKGHIEKALKGVAMIVDVCQKIKYYNYLSNSKDKNDYDKQFSSNLNGIIQTLRRRFIDMQITIDESSLQFQEVMYPSNIMLGILSEIIENARKVSQQKRLVLIKWWVKDSDFNCEVHDDGPGFQQIPKNKFVPVAALNAHETETSTGIGLSVLESTLIKSNGILFLSNSSVLSGGLVYFKFPVFNFTIKPD